MSSNRDANTFTLALGPRDYPCAMKPRRRQNSDTLTPSTATVFWCEATPRSRVIARRGTWSVRASSSISASFAAPSTGGACTQTCTFVPTQAMRSHRARRDLAGDEQAAALHVSRFKAVRQLHTLCSVCDPCPGHTIWRSSRSTILTANSRRQPAWSLLKLSHKLRPHT